MRIHKEGYIILFWGFILLLLINLIIYFVTGKTSFRITGYVLSAFLYFFLLQFFRSPLRKNPNETNAIVAPADGKIVAIQETVEEEYFKDKRIQVSIFMSPLNVHVNWLPVSGKIMYARYHPGLYLVAWHPKSSTKNERTTFAIKTEHGEEILVRQIAGIVARRIVWYPKEGEQVTQGDELGFIKFGSRVDLFLPMNTPIKVKMGDAVTGVETVIGRW